MLSTRAAEDFGTFSPFPDMDRRRHSNFNKHILQAAAFALVARWGGSQFPADFNVGGSTTVRARDGGIS